MKKISALFFVLSALFFATQHTAYAVDESGVKVIPATIEKLANPGDVLTEALEVTNVSNEDKEYYIYKKNIKGVQDGGTPVFATDNLEPTGFEIADWIEIQSDPVPIKKGETVSVPVTIRIPENASPGSHFGGVFVSLEPPRLRETGAAVGYEVASIISIRINGDIRDDARVRSLATSKLFYPSKHVHFIAKIENQGNILIRPHGPLTITSMFGGKTGVVSVNESLAGVFPGTVRDLEFDWNEDGIGFGRYEAVLALAYDGESGQKTIDASVFFWVFPTNVIVSILIGFIAIIVIGYLFSRYYINQALMRAAGGRRISSYRYKRQVGVSRFTFVLVSIMGVFVVFLILLLIFFA